ncbi:MAG: methyltransferase domain-containing protein [Planctomycetota bacterium]|nr:methyltransferase domain-containing protein [Planctomycetota bacterium]
MARSAPFEAHHARYDDWFERHPRVYLSELLALRALMPLAGRGLEIGVGTGRFAAPLGIQVGLDPSPRMLEYAARRGIEVHEGTAEELPFPDAGFDIALSVTTLCFVDDLPRMLAEAFRVLRPGGTLLLGFIDRGSALGEDYLYRRLANVFYKAATFVAGDELEPMLAQTGFRDLVWAQTITRPFEQIKEIEPAHPGRGQGLFVCVRARRA